MRALLAKLVQVVEFCICYLFYIFCRLLGVSASQVAIAALARFVGQFTRMNQKARERLGEFFPHFSWSERQLCMRQMWSNLGSVVAEYANIDKIQVGGPYLEVDGLEHLLKLKDDGKPGLIFAGHIANWEMVAVACRDHGVKTSQVYRAANSPYVNRLIRAIQLKVTSNLIPKGPAGGRKSLESLNKGEHLILLIDQKMNNGISVPFFGKEAMTPPGLARLAEKFMCPVLPAQVVRLESGKLKVIFHPAIHFPADGSKDGYREFMITVHAYLEQWITQEPGQWLWLHNRWDV
jgi:KDO2-lipid IV(A) lauroyltransferase